MDTSDLEELLELIEKQRERIDYFAEILTSLGFTIEELFGATA